MPPAGRSDSFLYLAEEVRAPYLQFPPPHPLLLPVAYPSPDVGFLLLVNLLAVVAVIIFAAGVVIFLQRRSYRRRFEEEELVAVGTAMARILHQIKNPLQTVMLQAELLQDETVSADAEVRREICQVIISESERLAAMLNEIGVWASGSRRTLTLEPVPLHLLVQQLVRREGVEAERAGIELKVSRLDEAIVLADPYFLRQALENLLRNAREAVQGREAGRVTVGLERAEAVAAVWVRDNGPGIGHEDLEKIFAPFVSTRGKGMGLGLPICREIVHGHGGEVRVESQPGTSTTFTVLLPLERGSADARHAPPGAPEPGLR